MTSASNCASVCIAEPVARLASIEAVGDGIDLLEVILEREIEKWTAASGAFHRSTKPSLHDGQISGGQMFVKIVYVTPRA